VVAQTLSPGEASLLAELAETELSRRSFLRFLNHVKVISDDPMNPTITRWEPWPYLIEQAQAWESRSNEVVLKDRQLGYSWLFAAYAVWRARGGAAVALISKGEDEAKELLRKCAFIEKHVPEYMRLCPDKGIKTERMDWPNSGLIMAFPSTPDAGVSYTFQLIGMDEAAFHPNGALNYAAILPTISAGGQFIALSTADPSLSGTGFFAQLYWDSKAGETGYKSRFIPWHVRPGRDAEWLDVQRRRYKGLPEMFDAYYADTDAQAFRGKSGLVFPMWDDQRHIWAARPDYPHPWNWADSIRHVAGVDFGGGDPTAVLPLGMNGQHKIHQFGEFYQRGPVSVYDIAAFLGQYPARAGIVVCDPSQGTAIETLDVTLKGTGWRARKADNKRGEGLDLVRVLLENDRLTIHETCKDSIAEFPAYRWAERTDPNDRTRYATKTPVDHHADGHDARRYGVMELTAMLRPMNQMPTKALNGTRLRRTAV